jgi:hypothetical protein
MGYGNKLAVLPVIHHQPYVPSRLPPFTPKNFGNSSGLIFIR